MGNGVSGNGAQVDAIAVSGSDVYFGGDFTYAGDLPSEGLAPWVTPAGKPRLTAPVRTSSSRVQFNLIGWTGLTYSVQYSTALTNWNLLQTTNASTNTVLIADPNATNTTRFYRAIAQ